MTLEESGSAAVGLPPRRAEINARSGGGFRTPDLLLPKAGALPLRYSPGDPATQAVPREQQSRRTILGWPNYPTVHRSPPGHGDTGMSEMPSPVE